jgi:hypothetical protein
MLLSLCSSSASMLREHGAQRPTVFELLDNVHRMRGTRSLFSYVRHIILCTIVNSTVYSESTTITSAIISTSSIAREYCYEAFIESTDCSLNNNGKRNAARRVFNHASWKTIDWQHSYPFPYASITYQIRTESSNREPNASSTYFTDGDQETGW